MADRATVFWVEAMQSCLRLAQLTQTTDGAKVNSVKKNIPAHSSSGGGVKRPGATGNDLVAGVAVPDTDGSALHGVLAAERAGVAAVLRDFDLLDLATERRAVARAVLACDSNLDRALRLYG